MKIKKIAGLSLALALACGTLPVIGCGENGSSEEKKVMNVSLNPQVEFVLDVNDTVVSVNALNEEGNLIVSAETFTGKSAEEAAKLFVEVSKETGFLVTGNVNDGENEIEISFSGDADAAKKLYDDVKTTVQAYLDESGVTATLIQATAITEEALEKLVAECAPYLELAKIEAMEYAELVDELLASRKETAGFYSQELKNAYYEAKSFALEQAELTAVKDTLDGVSQIAFDMAYGGYTTAVSLIESTRQSVLVLENSPYQLALKTFRSAKAEYLNYRNQVAQMKESELTTAVTEQLAALDAAVESAETALLNAGASANDTLDDLKAQVESAYDQVVSLIDEYSARLDEYAEQVSTRKTEALESFFAKVETDYAAAALAAKNGWAEMRSALTSDSE